MVRRQHIERVTAELLAARGITAPPVPIEQLARKQGARLIYQPLENSTLSVVLYRTGEQFTIAHALGHQILGHEPREQLLIDRAVTFRWLIPGKTEPAPAFEREASYFAFCLLMPAAWLEQEEATLDWADDEPARALAKRYGVTLPTLVLRLCRLQQVG